MTVWIKRIAAAGFLLFLLKGLAWIGIVAVVALWSL